MDASQRWETEALRSGSLSRTSPPRPSAKQQTSDTNWVTLREAETATGIPVNTLRKWAWKNAIPTYLRPDGDVSLRMVDLDAVITHAHELGRHTVPRPDAEPEIDDETVEVEPLVDDVPDEDTLDDTVDEFDPAPDTDAKEPSEPSDAGDDSPPSAPEGTLIVPLDAWNKMLNQLGNLHEAGQQLAEARERAAKAETEAKFLRERLAEVRTQNTDGSELSEELGVPLSKGTAEERSPDAGVSAEPQSTSYWRYLTFGWRDRKKRS